MTLKERIEKCSACPLRAKLTEFEKPIFGVGSDKPKVMIVIDNNTSESLFLIDGIKLEYLEKNLSKYQIKKSDLYITPLVKCARKPTMKSVNLCKDWILEESSTFSPKQIIIISSFDFKYHNPKSGIIWYKTSLSKLATSTAEDKKYTDIIFTKIKEHCA